MIKINLLDSVTERQGGAVIAVERKIGSPATRLLVMSIAVGFLLVTIVGIHFIGVQMAKARAEREIEEQKQIAAELEAVTKEMKDLELKIQNIDGRIDLIKKLRASQAGPSAVLDAMRERIASTPGLYLESVEQAGDVLTVKGNSPDEAAVTRFGQSLEFSGGLFSNLSIETQRKEAPNQANPNPEAPKLEIVGFTIRCAYTPSKANGAGNSMPTTAANVPPAGATPNQPATAPNGTTPPQVAKN